MHDELEPRELEPRELEYVETEDLIEELLTRGELVVIAVKRMGYLPGANVILRRWKGPGGACCELIASTSLKIAKDG